MIYAQRTIPAVQPSPTVPAGFNSRPTTTSTPPQSHNMNAEEINTTGSFVSSEDQFSGILQDASLTEIIQKFVVIAFIIAGLLSAIFIFVGGISFILSGGNDEKIKKAVNTIRYSIVGLIVTIFSFTFVTIIGRFFGLNFLDYISWDMIKESIQQVISTTKSDGNSQYSVPPRR